MRPVHIDDFQGEYRPSGSQINYRRCPVCGSTGWKVYVNPDNGTWCCFAGECGARGRVKVGVEMSALMRKLHAREASTPTWHEVGLPPYMVLSPAAVGFLQRYRIDKFIAERYMLVEGTGDMAGRIIIPYCNDEGSVVYWNSRSFTGLEPKYHAMGGKHPLYLPHYSMHIPKDPRSIVLVEGAFDAIKVCQHTDSVAAALGGKQLPKYLLPELLKIGRENVTVMLDSDALDSAIKLRNYLEPYYHHVEIKVPPTGEDPGSMSALQLKEIFQ